MTLDQAIRPGAEAWSHDGGPVGVLVLHGFTGNPSSMRGLAEAMAAAGHSVELPRLPGHGTTVEDMNETSFTDWSAEVEAAYQRLAARTERIVVAGLSMGGALAAWIGARHPEIAGLVFINAAVESNADMLVGLEALLDAGTAYIDGAGNDVADPDVDEDAYDKIPVASLVSLAQAAVDLQDDLARLEMPSLVLSAKNDHVVPPSNSLHLFQVLPGPVELVRLDRSFHVATIDLDRDLIVERVRDFVARVTA